MKSILVIEDESFIREHLQDLLEREGFKTIGAKNGQEGIHLAQTCLPDLILCDIQMPGIDGYVVLSTLQQSTRTAVIPFIFLTARTTLSDLRRGMNLGADDYLIKPCSVEDLMKAIAKRLEKRTAYQERTQQQLNNLRTSIALSLPHEFRTPLSSLLTATELLRIVSVTPDQGTLLEIADNIQISVERLQRLVQNFILYADLELLASSEQQTIAQPDHFYSPTMLITRIATDLAKRFHRETDIRLELQEGVVAFPESELEKVVQEVVDNAFKFSPPGSSVWITNMLGPDRYTLIIKDQGRGMTVEQIANIGAYLQFERDLYEQQGIGLGLAIVRHLLHLYRASLSIESIPGKYTAIQISLPGYPFYCSQSL